MNTHLVILLLLSSVILVVVKAYDSSAANVNVTTLRPTVERVFSRKKRAILFPQGTALKFTGALSKHLISKYPSGFNMVIETAFYYPIAGKIQDLYPKRFRKPTTTTKPKPTKPVYVYIPGTDLKYKVKEVYKKPTPMRLHQRIDTNVLGGQVQYVDSTKPTTTTPYDKYTNPQKWLKWSKYGEPGYTSQYAWTPARQEQYSNKQWWSPTRTWDKWQSTPWPRSHRRHRDLNLPPNETSYDEWPRRGRSVILRTLDELPDGVVDVPEDEHQYTRKQFDDLEPFEDSKHYHGHRDRRELFHHFEGFSKLLGFDMKWCILRAICDSKRFLLPPGYSMIQDILRVIFQFPTISGLDDEYSRMMRAGFDECNRQLPVDKCPLNLLHWLMNPNKANAR